MINYKKGKPIKEYNAEYRRKNKDKIAEYRRKNKDKIAEYRRKNKDKIAEQGAEYRRKNKEAWDVLPEAEKISRMMRYAKKVLAK